MLSVNNWSSGRTAVTFYIHNLDCNPYCGVKYMLVGFNIVKSVCELL
jgi:hypothetical protein